MKLITGQEELTFDTGPNTPPRSCQPGCTGQSGCIGPMYLALDVARGPRLKTGWTHSMPALNNRARDHARAQLQVTWYATATDDGMALTWDFEQELHEALSKMSPPYAGREYYLISQPVYSVLYKRLLGRCLNAPATARTLERLRDMHIADLAVTHYRLESQRRGA